MPSTIAGQSLFNSGPHRFIIHNLGTRWLPPYSLDLFQGETVTAGPIELRITQFGRLVAASETDLRNQLDAIKAAAESELRGTLIDAAGQSWPDMTLLTFRPADQIDRGRTTSLAYTADYIRLANP